MTAPTSQTPGTQPEEPPRSLVPEPPRQAGVDRFDDAIVVTRTRAWIGLAACLALLIGVIVWATTATVNHTVTGSGVALVNGTITRVESPVAGTVVEWRTDANQLVRASQVLGWVETGNHRRVPLVTPISGRVLNLEVGVGATVVKGQPMSSITAVRGPLVILAFLKPADAQLVFQGMRALLSFPGGQAFPGQVVHVGALPITRQEVASGIGSPALADIVAPSGSVVAITVAPTGLKAGGGTADAGDVTSVTVIVGSTHPINYVF